MESKERIAFLKELGTNINAAIYAKYKTKEEFLAATGILKKSLHLVITGGNARVGTIHRIAKELGLKVKDLLPKE